MRKSLQWLLLLLTSIVMVACGHGEEDLASWRTLGEHKRLHYLGSQGDAAALQSHFDVALVDRQSLADLSETSGKILIVDGRETVDRDLVKSVVLAGNAVIALRQTESLRGLFADQWEATAVHSMDSDGYQRSETAYGSVQLPTMSKTFHTDEADPMQAAALAYEWAKEALSEKNDQVSAPASTWQLVLQRSYSSGDNWKPQGRVRLQTMYYQLQNDGSTAYDWWLVRFKVKSEPGHALWGNGWVTADIWNKVHSDHRFRDYKVIDHNPISYNYPPMTDVQVSLLVDVGIKKGQQGAQVTASETWDYDATDVDVLNQSNLNANRVDWWHNVDENKSVGRKAYQAQPGAVIRVPNGTTALYNKMWEYYRVQWWNTSTSPATPWSAWLWWDGFDRGDMSLMAQHSGKCVDVSEVSRDDQANVYQWECHRGNNQKWKLQTLDDRYYKIVVKHSGKCLDLSHNNNIVQHTCHNGDNQRFKLIHRHDDYYAIQVKASGKCLDVHASSQNNGGDANIQQGDCLYGANQLFAIEPTSTTARNSDFQHVARVMMEASRRAYDEADTGPIQLHGVRLEQEDDYKWYEKVKVWTKSRSWGKTYLIAFRGSVFTGSWADFWNDMYNDAAGALASSTAHNPWLRQSYSGQVGTGFYQRARRYMLSEPGKRLKKNIEDQNAWGKTVYLYVTGHSLGAAASQQCAFFIHKWLGSNQGLKNARHFVQNFSFNTPRGGNATFARNVAIAMRDSYLKAWNFTVHLDPVSGTDFGAFEPLEWIGIKLSPNRTDGYVTFHVWGQGVKVGYTVHRRFPSKCTWNPLNWFCNHSTDVIHGYLPDAARWDGLIPLMKNSKYRIPHKTQW